MTSGDVDGVRVMGAEYIPEKKNDFDRKKGRKNDAGLITKNIYSTTNSICSSK